VIESVGQEQAECKNLETCAQTASLVVQSSKQKRKARIFSSATSIRQKLLSSVNNQNSLRIQSRRSEDAESARIRKKRCTAGCWKKVKENGATKNIYISISGERFEGSAAVRASKLDENAMEQRESFLASEVSVESIPDARKLSNWDIPIAIERMYFAKGITQLYEWQVECLSLDGVLQGENLVYSAPTNGGKTLGIAHFILF
jgi:hypothetical protein